MSVSRQVSAILCRVPGELLEKTLEYLLPEIKDIETLRYPLCRGDVSDLCQCRLVCQTFYDVASRLLWWRIELVLPGHKTSTSITTSFTTYLSWRIYQFTNFLVDHAMIRKYVRLLTITTNGPKISQDVAITTISRLSIIARMLTNVRVLSLHNASILPSHTLLTLLQLPSLHTVRLEGLDCSRLLVDRSTVSLRIQQLGIYRCKQPERLYACLPCLRAFEGEMENDTFASMPPWRSIQEAFFQIELSGWDRMARNFMAWRDTRRNIPLSLTELVICQWHFNPKIKDIDPIIAPFSGNPLTKLILFYVEIATTSLIERIARYFPRLKNLSFLSDEELSNWPNRFDSYGRALHHLRDLQLLKWNNYDGGDQTYYGSWDIINEDQLVDIAPSIAQTCVNLRRVNFCLVIDGLTGVEITRDIEGNPETVVAEYSDSWVYCTSAWKSVRFINI